MLDCECNISGSGKTSLLDVIACRTEGRVTGKVYYNNYECSKEVIKQYGAYVMQADRFLHNLTVRETLRYAAYLRLPGRTKKFEIENKVRVLLYQDERVLKGLYFQGKYYWVFVLKR